MGEHIAFSVSSATPYVNGALGARSNRESSISALAAAVVGRTPYYGYHVDENRHGDILIEVDAELNECYDRGILGHCIGEMAGSLDPVLVFKNKVRPSQEDFLYFGAEAATRGAVAMYHMVGITPEAPTLEAAFGERLFAGRKVSHITAYSILAVSGAVELAERSRLRQKLELLGVRMVGNTGSDEPCWKSFEGCLCVTDSPKRAYYRERRGQPFAIRRLSECVEAAIKGRLD